MSIAALSVAAYALQSSHQLVIDGNVVSDHLILQNGRYLVPVTDVAKYFGYQFKQSGGIGVLSKNGGDPSRGQAFTSPGTVVPPPDAPTTPDLTPPPTFVPVTPLGAPPALPINAMPTTVVPGTAITTATANLFPDATQVPSKIDATVGKSSSVNGLDYTVDSIQDSGDRYKDRFDQRATTVHPAWKTDSLEVINLSVTNSSSQPISIYTPGVGDITVFDNEKIGFPAIAMDIRQSPDALNSDSTYDLAGMGGSGALMLGPGGTLRYAIIASVPKNERIGSLLINVPAASSNSATASPGAVITVNR